MQIIVRKLNEHGTFVWEYRGDILDHGESWVRLDARMGRDVPTDYVHFRTGDRMTEYFYTDRWYNVMRIEDVDDQRLKGWYCNITRPTHIDWSADPVIAAYDDLALDVFVSPDGTIRILDEDEFTALALSDAEQTQVWRAVAVLRHLVETRTAPFDEIAG